MTFEEITVQPKDEILTELPEEIRTMQSIEDRLQEMLAKDRVESNLHSTFSQVFETVNEEFEETAFTISRDMTKVNGHCLGNILCGA